MNDPLGILSTFERGAGRTGRFFSLPALEKKGFGAHLAPARVDPGGPRVAGPQPRRDARAREGRPGAGRLAAPRRADRGDPLRGLPRAGPGLHRRAAPRGPGGHARRHGPRREGPQPRSSRSCRWTWWSTTRCRWTPGAPPTRSAKNLELEFARNRERYPFLKWGTQAFERLPHRAARHRHLPPGEPRVPGHGGHRAGRRSGSPTRVVGTDSHTTMVNGLGVVGWGVGGIEAEAAMLGQPTSFLTPDVVGVNVHGAASRRAPPAPTWCSR